jgi:uncharacterized protein YcbK (DUF882 family)
MAGLIARPWRAGCLAALLVIFGSESLQNAVADGDTRTLTMHHMHTGEDITITFKQNGRYDDAALQKLNHFLRDWRREQSTRMDPHLLDLIWEVYQEVGGKEAIQIVCGFRSPETNAMLRRRSNGVARFSQHTLGKAIDFYIPGVSLEQLRYAGLRMQRGGVGYYPTSGSPFVHLDTGSVRHWPRMSSQQLAHVLATPPRTRVAAAAAKRNATLAALGRHDGDPGDDEATTAGQKPKRGLIARLFGFGDDEDEAEANAAPAKPAVKSEPPKPQVAANVPLPPVRPPRPTPPAQPAQAAAKPAPAQYTLASVNPSPSADMFETRGVWTPNAVMPAGPSTAAGDVKAPPPGAAAGGQRFVWLTGPQGRPVERTASAPAERPASAPAERPANSIIGEPPRPPAEVPNADQETTASLASWPDRAEKPRSEAVLAYAVAPGHDEELPRSASAAPTAARLAPAPATRSFTPPSMVAANPAQQGDNPWLRGLMLAPSVHYSMKVAAFGAPDYRQLARLMQKPASILMMTFSADPQPGMTSYSFTGPAVAFLPTVKFATRGNARTASLD